MVFFFKKRNLTKVIWKQEKYKSIYLHLSINQNNMNKEYSKTQKAN